jgi:hypothetical protein
LANKRRIDLNRFYFAGEIPAAYASNSPCFFIVAQAKGIFRKSRARSKGTLFGGGKFNFENCLRCEVRPGPQMAAHR